MRWGAEKHTFAGTNRRTEFYRHGRPAVNSVERAGDSIEVAVFCVDFVLSAVVQILFNDSKVLPVFVDPQ